MENILFESKDGKLVHIEHPEDIAVESSHGFNTAFHSLEKTYTAINHKTKPGVVTTKYDGAPSVVFGHHPETGKFFVATKSAFNEHPKLNYSHSDIEKNHEGKLGLQQKLKDAYTHLRKVAPKSGVYQGDLMYTKSDLHKDASGIHFKPNTITYSLSKNDAEWKHAEKAKIGIVLHTQYHGSNTLEGMKAHFNPNRSEFKQHKDVHMINPEHDTSKVHMETGEKEAYNAHVKAAMDIHNHLDKNHHQMLEKHIEHLKTYVNSAVREGRAPTYEGYRTHLGLKAERDIQNSKTDKSKSTKSLKWDMFNAQTKVDKMHIEKALEIHHHIQQAKNILVNTLSRHSAFNHSIGGKASKPEGFVVNHNNQPIKLVDRHEFSRANLTQEKTWR